MQPTANPATGETSCTWLATESGPTINLTIWQNPPQANSYDTQFAEAKYLATAKRCPGAYYRVISGLGDRAFASYCTTNVYNTDNKQSVTWQYRRPTAECRNTRGLHCTRPLRCSHDGCSEDQLETVTKGPVDRQAADRETLIQRISSHVSVGYHPWSESVRTEL